MEQHPNAAYVYMGDMLYQLKKKSIIIIVRAKEIKFFL